MAATLVGKGFAVTGYDPSAQARERAAARGVATVATLDAVLADSEVVVLSLPKAEHVEAICLAADGIAARGRAGSVVVDTTTSTPEASRKVARALAQAGIAFLDAPVSGGPAGAAAGTMTMVIGGDEVALAKASPVLEAMSATQVHVGAVGAGNVVKIANNLLCAAHLITTAEALALATRAGVAADKLIEGINAGSGRSGVSQVNFPRWVLNGAFDSGFTMGLMRKDVGLAHDLAAQLGLDLPLAQAVCAAWRESAATLDDAEDFNRIVLRTDAANAPSAPTPDQTARTSA